MAMYAFNSAHYVVNAGQLSGYPRFYATSVPCYVLLRLSCIVMFAGRTGRAGTRGRATSFFTDRDAFLVSQIKTALAELEKGNVAAFAMGKEARQAEKALAQKFKSNMKLSSEGLVASGSGLAPAVKVDGKYAYMATAAASASAGAADAAWVSCWAIVLGQPAAKVQLCIACMSCCFVCVHVPGCSSFGGGTDGSSRVLSLHSFPPPAKVLLAADRCSGLFCCVLFAGRLSNWQVACQLCSTSISRAAGGAGAALTGAGAAAVRWSHFIGQRR
jgi:hypothetical protein